MTFQIPLSQLLPTDGNVTYTTGEILKVGNGNITVSNVITEINGVVNVKGNISLSNSTVASGIVFADGTFQKSSAGLGLTGPTGPISTTPGPTGPTGAANLTIGPTGATGAGNLTIGPTGPTGTAGTNAPLNTRWGTTIDWPVASNVNIGNGNIMISGRMPFTSGNISNVAGYTQGVGASFSASLFINSQLVAGSAITVNTPNTITLSATTGSNTFGFGNNVYVAITGVNVASSTNSWYSIDGFRVI